MAWILRVWGELSWSQVSEAAGGILVMHKAGPRLIWFRQMGIFVRWRSSGASGCVCLRRCRWAPCSYQTGSWNSGSQGRKRRHLLCWLIWKRPEFSYGVGRQPDPTHPPSTVTWVMLAGLACLDRPYPTPLLLPSVTSSALWWFHSFGITFFVLFFFWMVQIYFYTHSREFLFLKIFWLDSIGNCIH